MCIDGGSYRSNHDTIMKFGRYPQRNQALGQLNGQKRVHDLLTAGTLNQGEEKRSVL
jgi:uncharacterized protein (DUF924 family)